MAVLLGHFPQLTADYGISSYYPAKEGIYVNLFVPSRALVGRKTVRDAL
jgi:hypothetical protein